MFIYSTAETIMVETKSNVFIDDIINSVISKFNDIDMQMERTG